MHRTRVKFCGITRPEDAQAAAQAGADAIGLVFYAPAAAAITTEDAVAITRAAPPFVDVVALFVNAAADFVTEVVRRARPSLLQFHGDEDAEYCQSFNMPYIKACRLQTADDIMLIMREHGDTARGVLLDAKVDDMYGGSGRAFDWTLIPAASIPLIIAGGLTAATVGGLITAHRPWAVDVSSGITCDDDKRRKDCDKMAAFIKEVRCADG